MLEDPLFRGAKSALMHKDRRDKPTFSVPASRSIPPDPQFLLPLRSQMHRTISSFNLAIRELVGQTPNPY